MQKFQLKTSLKWKHGQTNIIPFAGMVTYNENGETTVELPNADELTLLLNDLPDLKLIGTYHTLTAQDLIDNPELKETSKEGDEVILPQVEENELGKSEDDKTDIGGGADSEALAILEKSRMPELKQFATDSGFPESEWKELDKPKLKAYLIAKLTPATV